MILNHINNFLLQVKGLDLCQLAKDFKTKQKASMTSTALFFNDDIKSTLVEIVNELGIPTTSKQQRHLNLANKITQYVEKNCTLECLCKI